MVPPGESSWGKDCAKRTRFSRRVATLVAQAHERAAVDGGEDHVVTADVHRVRLVARLHVELPRRLRDLLEHELRIELHHGAVDVLPGLAELLDRLGEDELDAELGDDPPPAAVERLHGLAGEDLVARQGIDDHALSFSSPARPGMVVGLPISVSS
jgi:hypothetical protein